MTYEDDKIAKYLATLVQQDRLTYEKAITSSKTTKEAIDWWIEELK